MSGEQKKVAAEVVGIAKRKAAAREAVGLLKKADASRRKRLAGAGIKLAKSLAPGSLKGGKSQPASKAKLGSGGRFSALKGKLSHQKGVRDPGALAASIGRAKYGKGKMQSMAAKGSSALVPILKAAAGGWVPRKPHEPYEGQGWTPPKPHEPRMANTGGAGWTPPKPYEPARKPGWTPPKPYEPARGKQPAQPAQAAKPAAPAPAQMKSPPTKAPAKAPTQALGQYRKVSAELLALELLVKTAERLKKDRATTFKKAAAAYTKATASGNKERIKKAVAHLAGVMTFDEMTKQAISGEVGALIMRLLGKITPAIGRGAEWIGTEGSKNIGQRISEWGKLMGERGKGAWNALRSASHAGAANITDPLYHTIEGNPSLLKDVLAAKQIGTGALTAGGIGALGALTGD